MSSATHYLLRRGLEVTRGFSQNDDGHNNTGENGDDGLARAPLWVLVITAVFFLGLMFAVSLVSIQSNIQRPADSYPL